MFHGFIPHIMGTRFDILLIHSDAERLNGLWCHIINELERLDKILNRFDPHSEVSGINKHALLSYIQISKELEEILQLCQYYYENTFHLFDITLKDFSKIQIHDHQRISISTQSIAWSGYPTGIFHTFPGTISALSGYTSISSLKKSQQYDSLHVIPLYIA